MSHTSYLLQVTWTRDRRWISSRWQRSRGPESTRSSIKHVRDMHFKWSARWPTRGRARKHGSSSDGRNLSRLGALRDHPIFIGRPRSFAILATRGAFWCVWSPSRGRQRIARTTGIVRITIAWISIGWRGKLAEELHDRGPIKPRSRRDRAAIVEHLERSLHTIAPRDCATIMAFNSTPQPHQTAPIFGLKIGIMPAIEDDSAPNRSYDQRQIGAPSWWNQRPSFSNFIRRHGLEFNHNRGSRSWFDRGPIVTRS